MEEHLNEKCNEVKNPELTATYKKANELLAKFENMMSESEAKYMKCWIQSRRIPTPRLSIKDHKAPREDGTYPTRLLIPATNFTQCYAKFAYKAIKAIFEANKIQYAKHTIVQSTHLKCDLEKLNLRVDGNAICNLDIKDMYPST